MLLASANPPQAQTAGLSLIWPINVLLDEARKHKTSLVNLVESLPIS